MNPISLVITGPIASRFNRGVNEKMLLIALSKFKLAHKNNQVVISTYENETPLAVEAIIDTLVINIDPGPDYYRNNPWPISNYKTRNENSISRMFESSVAGLLKATNEIVVKTRIELIPTDFYKFDTWVSKICRIIQSDSQPRIGFLAQHYSGIYYSIDGTTGGIPDTLQISKKDVITNLWVASRNYWKANSEMLKQNKTRFPISSEQVLGFNYLKMYSDFSFSKPISKYKRNYLSLNLIRAVIYAEQKLYIFVDYNETGLSLGYLKNTSAIRVPTSINKLNKKQILLRIIMVLLKQLKHKIRRYKKGLRHNYRIKN
jgi:hypothetical protein